MQGLWWLGCLFFGWVWGEFGKVVGGFGESCGWVVGELWVDLGEGAYFGIVELHVQDPPVLPLVLALLLLPQRERAARRAEVVVVVDRQLKPN